MNIKAKIGVAVAGAALGALSIVGAAGAASASSTAATPCTVAPGGLQESVAVSGVTYYLATPNKIHSGSGAELKTNAASATTMFVHCNAAGNEVELTITQGGVTYALTNRSGNLVDLLPAQQFASQYWTYAGSNPYTFQNVKTHAFLRVPNKGPANYGPVVAGASATAWTQS